MNTDIPNAKPEITAAKFPALRSFLRGYFHEDVADEYGTPVDAADQFCEDADSDERIAVASEWTLLMTMLHGRPLPEINQALTGKLGGAVRLNEEEIQQVSQIFARCLALKPQRKVANH
jgi:CdiI immunity protein